MEQTYEFAGIAVHVKHRCPDLARQCADYRTERPALLSVEVTEEDVAQEAAISRKTSDAVFSAGYLESLAFYRKFCEAAAEHGVILLHGVAVETLGRAYLFAAPSGVGKTTHVRLWQKLLGERMRVINGDKPLVRVEESCATVYGTPWNGKEGMGEKMSAPLSGICFLRRAAENSIVPLSPQEALPALMGQLYRPRGDALDRAALTLALDLLERTECYLLQCNMSDEAAKLSIRTMTGVSL